MKLRRLLIRTVEVDAGRADAYLVDSARRADRARAAGQYFWLFQAEGCRERGRRYVEFTESPDAKPPAGEAPAAPDRWPGVFELRCTEVPLPASEP